MDSVMADAWGHILRFICMFTSAMFVVCFVILTVTWTMGAAEVDRAEADIKNEFATKGSISESKVTEFVNRYCQSNSSYKSCREIEISGSNNYIGAPMSVDFVAVFDFMGRDIPIHGHADYTVGSTYGKGYLTINQI